MPGENHPRRKPTPAECQVFIIRQPLAEPILLATYHRTTPKSALCDAALSPPATPATPIDFAFRSAVPAATPAAMLSLIFMVLFVHVAIYLVNTIGATTIDSLVRLHEIGEADI